MVPIFFVYQCVDRVGREGFWVGNVNYMGPSAGVRGGSLGSWPLWVSPGQWREGS